MDGMYLYTDASVVRAQKKYRVLLILIIEALLPIPSLVLSMVPLENNNNNNTTTTTNTAILLLFLSHRHLIIIIIIAFD